MCLLPRRIKCSLAKCWNWYANTSHWKIFIACLSCFKMQSWLIVRFAYCLCIALHFKLGLACLYIVRLICISVVCEKNQFSLCLLVVLNINISDCSSIPKLEHEKNGCWPKLTCLCTYSTLESSRSILAYIKPYGTQCRQISIWNGVNKLTPYF